MALIWSNVNELADRIIGEKICRKVVVAVSGHFSPCHVGHLRMMQAARNMGGCLVVIVNSDYQVRLKKSVPFMNENDRMEIVAGFGCVDHVCLAVDEDRTVCDTLYFLRPEIFANGGDVTPENNRERLFCQHRGIRLAYNVGGGKADSSSKLIRDAADFLLSHP